MRNFKSNFFKIIKKLTMKSFKTYIIAEAGINHNSNYKWQLN